MAAKYVRLFSEQKIDVVLVEPNDAFVSCPISNLVIGGSKTLADMTVRYDTLASKHGVRVVKDMVASMLGVATSFAGISSIRNYCRMESR